MSACFGEEKKADNWPQNGDKIYVAEMHVHCGEGRELRFLGPFRNKEQSETEGANLRETAVKEQGNGSDYKVTYWTSRVFLKGAKSNPPIVRPKPAALACS